MRIFLMEGEGPRCDGLKSLQPGLALKAGSWEEMGICKPRKAAWNLGTSWGGEYTSCHVSLPSTWLFAHLSPARPPVPHCFSGGTVDSCTPSEARKHLRGPPRRLCITRVSLFPWLGRLCLSQIPGNWWGDNVGPMVPLGSAAQLCLTMAWQWPGAVWPHESNCCWPGDSLMCIVLVPLKQHKLEICPEQWSRGSPYSSNFFHGGQCLSFPRRPKCYVWECSRNVCNLGHPGVSLPASPVQGLNSSIIRGDSRGELDLFKTSLEMTNSKEIRTLA